NSSTACFWLKQVSQAKGGDQHEPWGWRYEFTGTKLQQFPIPDTLPGDRGRLLDELATTLSTTSPKALLDRASGDVADLIAQGQAAWHSTRARMIFEQEELDWE